jgi:hypothetical protein
MCVCDLFISILIIISFLPQIYGLVWFVLAFQDAVIGFLFQIYLLFFFFDVGIICYELSS